MYIIGLHNIWKVKTDTLFGILSLDDLKNWLVYIIWNKGHPAGFDVNP